MGTLRGQQNYGWGGGGGDQEAESIAWAAGPVGSYRIFLTSFVLVLKARDARRRRGRAGPGLATGDAASSPRQCWASGPLQQGHLNRLVSSLLIGWVWVGEGRGEGPGIRSPHFLPALCLLHTGREGSTEVASIPEDPRTLWSLESCPDTEVEMKDREMGVRPWGGRHTFPWQIR